MIDLLDGHVDPARAAPEREQLAIAHARAVPVRQSGIAFFQALSPHVREDPTLQRCGGHYHLARRQPKEAVAWFRRAANLQPQAARTKLALWQALARAGRKGNADTLLREVDLNKIEGDVADRIDLAQLLWQKGRTEALNYAYDVASTHRDDPSVCLSFFGFVLAEDMIPGAPSLPSPQTVARDAWVRLTRHDGSAMEFVVAEAADASRGHFAHDHPIAAGAMGLSIGDRFEIGEGPGRAEWTVAEIKHRALHLFHTLSSNFQDRFPDQRSFWSLRTVDDDVEPFLEQVRAGGPVRRTNDRCLRRASPPARHRGQDVRYDSVLVRLRYGFQGARRSRFDWNSGGAGRRAGYSHLGWA